jgi:phosphoadenosine phosphosulfate reductase
MTQTQIDPVLKAQTSTWLEFLPPQQTLRWAVETFAPRLVMTSAFGLAGVALLHMLRTITDDVPIVFVDTGFMFEETLETRHRIEAAYGVQILTYQPLVNVGAQAQPHNPDLCCALRKVEPMQRALTELQPVAVLNARTRFQASTRRKLPLIEWDRTPIRINPLALWPRHRIERFVKRNSIPYNPLYDRGYPSVGCQPCTRPVAEGDDIRAGRWAGSGKIECGLWTRVGAAA